MSSNWPKVKLREVCKIRRGSSPRPIIEFMADKGMPWVKISDATESVSRFIEKTKEFIKYEGVPKSVIVNEGDLILSNSGTAGLPKFMKITACIHDGWQTLSDFDGIDKYFLYYSLLNIRSNLIRNANDSTMKNLTLDMVRDAEICLPSLSEQKAISKVLSDIDSKIELNTSTNQALEQTAQALFKSWFVDFDPVKAKIEILASGGSNAEAELAAMSMIAAKDLNQLDELKENNPDNYAELVQTAALFPKMFAHDKNIPFGWKVGVISDIAKLNANSWTNKNQPEQVHYVDLSNTKNGVIDTITTYSFKESPSRARRILTPGDTVIGTVRPGNKSYALIGETEKQLTGSTGFAVLTPIEELWTSFVYFAVTNDESIEMYAHLADGGAYPAIKAEVVAHTSCTLAAKNIMQKFWQITGPIFEKIHQNRLENEELAHLRDTILPKILSGEIAITSESRK